MIPNATLHLLLHGKTTTLLSLTQNTRLLLTILYMRDNYRHDGKPVFDNYPHAIVHAFGNYN